MDHNAFFSRLREGMPSGLYLFHGPEEYIKQSAREAVANQLDAVARDMNIQSFEKPTADSVRVACETLPFMSERRVVVCQDMLDAEVKLLLPYVPDMSASTLLLLYMRGSCAPALLKQIRAVGKEVLFDTLREADALRFVLDRAKKRNATIERRTAALLVDMVGTDVHALENELLKVVEYAGGEGALLEEAHVVAVITPNPEYQRYSMLDDFLAGNAERGLHAMATMLKAGSESVFGLAHFFTGQCKSMLLARLLLDSGVREREIAGKLNLYPKAARAAIAGAGRHCEVDLRNAVLAFSEVDYLQVSGQANGEQALHMAVLRYFCA